MKRFFLAALAIAAIASCAKNEVVSPENQSQEITFQTVQTKAATPMNTNNKFISYAWFLPNGSEWDSDNDDSKAYISGATIGYNTTESAWKAENTYYWPKQGSLTFFSWSINTNTNPPALTGATVSCTNANGITVTNYDLTQNKNVDFLVADIAKDQTENTTTISPWKAGVPTVFRHALSKLEFKVVTVDNGGTAKDYSSENVSFTLKSIALTGVNNNKTYAQGNITSAHTWTEKSPVDEISSLPVYTNNDPGFTVTSAPQTLVPSANDYYIVLPQNMDADDMLEIVYEITTSYTTPSVTETVSQSVKLSEIYPSNWQPTKNYVLTIKLGINEIYWAPSVETWTEGGTPSTQF